MATRYTIVPFQQQRVSRLCKACGGSECDIIVESCGCHLHVRCAPFMPGCGQSNGCAFCKAPSSGVRILPISLSDLDQKVKESIQSSMGISPYTGLKRPSNVCADPALSLPAGQTIESASILANDRTGRWTTEEVDYVNSLVAAFDEGALLISDGTKMHDFLTALLKCKLSRLTKKFKSANFTRGYTRNQATAMGAQGYKLRRALAASFEKFMLSQFKAVTQEELRILTAAQWRKYFVEYCKIWGNHPVEQMTDFEIYNASVDALQGRIDTLHNERRKRRKMDVTAGRARSGIALVHAQRAQDAPLMQQMHACPLQVTSCESTALDFSRSSVLDVSRSSRSSALDVSRSSASEQASARSRSFGDASCLSFNPFQSGSASPSLNNLEQQDLEPVPVASTTAREAKANEDSCSAAGTFQDDADDETAEEDFLSLFGISKEDDNTLVTDDEITGCSVSVSDSTNKGKSDGLDQKDICYSPTRDPRKHHQQVQHTTNQVEVAIISSLARHVSQNRELPFEYYDVWTPKEGSTMKDTRLVFAGSHFANVKSPSPQLMRFASFSSTFDFKAGDGMPGRVFSSRQPCWEQQVQFASSSHFKRAEGAAFAGIQTAVGIPIICTHSGKMLVIGCYSRSNIERNDELVYKLWTDFSKFATTNTATARGFTGVVHPPEAKSMSQVKTIKQPTKQSPSLDSCSILDDLVTLLAEQIPVTGQTSSADELNLASGYMHLRMLLLRAPSIPPQSAHGDMVRLICNSYSLYKATSRRSRKDLANVVVREYLLLMSGTFPSSPPRRSSSSSVSSTKNPGLVSQIICHGRNHSLARS